MGCNNRDDRSVLCISGGVYNSVITHPHPANINKQDHLDLIEVQDMSRFRLSLSRGHRSTVHLGIYRNIIETYSSDYRASIL